MTALWIILAVALVLTVLNLLPVGVDAAYADDVFSLAARIGPFRLRLLPKPPDQKPKKKKPPKPKKEKPKKRSAPPDLRRVGSVRHGAGVRLCQRRARRAHAAGGAGAAYR